jgi:capsular exopolysaccharide synthesis family protein
MTEPSDTPSGLPFDQDLNVRYYAELLWRRRLLVVAAALGGLALGILAGEVQTPRFRATALLQVSPPTPTSLSVTDALVGTGSVYRDRQFYNTQFKVLRSRELGQKVVERLELTRRPPFDESADPAMLFTSHVRLQAVPDSLLIEVQLSHEDPDQAALWANTLAEVYLEDSMEARVESVRRAYEWLQDRMSATQDSMRQANEQLLESYQSQDLVVPEGSVSAVSTSIARLNDEYIAAQTRRIAIEAALKQISGLRSRGQSLDRVPQVASDGVSLDLDRRLAGLDVELSRLRNKYKDAHPEIQKVESQIAQIRKAKGERSLEIEQGMRAEYRQLQGREAELLGALARQRARATDQTLKVAELESLKKQAETAGNLYGVLLQKLSETNIAASVQNDNVRIVQRAWPPASPVWPQRGRLAGWAALLGLVLGVGFVLARDYLDNTIKTPEEVERYLHLDLLAAVPRYDKDTSHLVTEAYQALRTALLFGRRGEEGQVVLIVGATPGEGKTTTVVNIGKLLAVSGDRTVVVDADLRRANLHNRLGVPREPGLTDVFTRSLEPTVLTHTTRVRNLSILPAGKLPPNPPALLARQDVTRVLDELKRLYRWVLIDSPPLASVTDGLLLARHADMTVMVVQHNHADKKVARRGVLALSKVTDSLIGVVLNAVDIQTQGYQYYYYYPQRRDAEDAAAKSASGPRSAA